MLFLFTAEFTTVTIIGKMLRKVQFSNKILFLKLAKLEASRRPLFSLDHISDRMFSIANGAETRDKVIISE